ncbi:PAS domain-containing sensor histidine kinase [Melioribacter sp. OK-6-Me]|uniref:PAS domain-containing sensor histidine kinase n=1 Tax=unclassified Melioribacter TaxID=2627329 RepID=UPI003ED84016
MHNKYIAEDNTNFVEDLKLYKELPASRAIVIVDSSLNILYCNSLFTDIFHLNINDSLHRLNPTSEFLFLIKGFLNKNFRNLTFDVTINTDYDNGSNPFQVDIERIFIKGEQFFLINVDTQKNRKEIEWKIDSLHTALDLGNVPIIIADDKGNIVFATHSVENILDKSIEELFYLNIKTLFKEFLNDEYDLFLRAVDSKTGWKKIITLKGKEKEEFWDIHLHPFVATYNRYSGFIISAHDLTEIIYQKQIIEQSEKKQKLIIENISDLLLITRRENGNLVLDNANDNFCRLFELNKSEIMNQKLSDIISEDLYNKIQQSISEIENGPLELYEFGYECKKDRHYNCKVTYTNAGAGDDKIFIVTLKDITEEKKYREQLEVSYLKEVQLNKMKSNFLANISHEIRTPFNGIIGYSEIINDCLEAKDYVAIKEITEQMKDVLGRVLELFTNIVDLSQIESGEIEIENVVLNCNQIIKHVYDKKYREAEKKGLEFRMELSDSEAMIEVDWVKLEKIIELLVDNAIKYTHKGYVYLGSRIEGTKIRIIIEDSGIGMNPGDIERLLSPFSQEVEGYTRPYEGLGLGLTIAYKLTKLMNGNFEINSEKNKGTQIVITFEYKDYGRE